MDKYELFVVSVEKGSISAAAESLNYTQSGVSYAIAALEKEVGYQLLKRQKSGVSLTPKGEHFYPFFLDLVNQKRRLDQEVDALQNQISGDLRLGTFPSVTSRWIPSLITDLKALYPDVRYVIHDGDYNEILSLIIEEKIDCGFLPRAVVKDSLAFYPLLNDRLFALLPPEHPLAKEKAVSLDDFLSYPLIIQSFGDDAVVQELLSRANGKPNVQCALRDDMSIMKLVEAGLGVAFMGGLFRDICPANVVFKPFDPPASRQIGLVVKDPKRLTAVTRAFIDFIKSYDLTAISPTD